MKIAKKTLSVFLSIMLILSAFGANYVFAEEERIIFSADASGLSEEATVTTASTSVGTWTKVMKGSSQIIAADDGGNTVFKLFNPTANGSPYLTKNIFIIDGLRDVTVEFKFRKDDGESKPVISILDGENDAKIVSIGKDIATTMWTTVKLEFDLKKYTYNEYIDGKQTASKADMPAKPEAILSVKLGSDVRAGSGAAYYDDIKISTTSDVDVKVAESGQLEALTNTQFIQKFEKKITGSPAPILEEPKDKLFTFTGTNGVEKISAEFSAGKNAIGAEVGGNAVILTKNDSIVKGTASFAKLAELGDNAADLTVEYNVFFVGDGNTYLSAKAANKKVFTGTPIESTNKKANSGWNNIKYEFDFKKNTYTSYLNDTKIDKAVQFTATATSYADFAITFNFTMASNESTVAFDNLSMFTKTPVTYNTLCYGAEGVSWDMVKGTGAMKDYLSNMRSHPRMFITSWDDVKTKINKSAKLKNMSDMLIASADKLLTADYVPYTFSNGRNWLGGARNLAERCETLGYAYGITGDKKYVSRCLDEIRHCGAYPNWTPTAAMIPEEAVFGISLFYDWAYDALTAEDRADIIKIVQDKMLWQYIHSYSGYNDISDVAKGNTNRNALSASCGAAISIAAYEEIPEIADFVLENASKAIKRTVDMYGKDGGYFEGTGYWALATKYIAFYLGVLVSANGEGRPLPPAATDYLNLDSMKNTGNFHIYMGSNVGMFNFGDANETINGTEATYWLAKQYNKPIYTWYQERYSKSTPSGLFVLLFSDPDNPPAYGGEPLDYVFNDVDESTAMSMRSSFADHDQLYVAMQGGVNATGHVFTSLGTFIIDANGKRFIKTLGRGDYNYEFSADSYYQKRAEGNNCIVINPDQSAGQSKGEAVKFSDFKYDNDEAYSVLDLSKAYLASANSVKRGTFMTKGRKSVVIQDEISCKEPSEIYWFAHTDANITLTEDKKSALLDIDGEKLIATITASPNGEGFEIMESKPLPTSPVAPDEVYKSSLKLAIHMTNTKDATIAVEFTPLKSEFERAETHEVKPISSWVLEPRSTERGIEDIAGDSVVLMVNSPAAFAAGARSYIDDANMGVTPVIDNDRTLVPVRFISEKFGADVSWNAMTRIATVKTEDKTISLTLDSDKMTVNDKTVTLDVPAKVLNDRTVIPLRALVEAMGKNVLWDNRGLIVISDGECGFTDSEITRMCDILKTRILVGGNDLKGFTEQDTSYAVTSDASLVCVLYDGNVISSASGNTVSFSVGGKDYTVNCTPDIFAGRKSTNAEGILAKITVSTKADSNAVPVKHTYIDVKEVEMSTGKDKYIPEGTIDNVINNEIINRWSGNGDGAYLIYDLGEKKYIHAFGLATLNGNQRQFKIRIELSDSGEGEMWTPVFDGLTSGTTIFFDKFPIGREARYVKVTGFGDTDGGTYNSWTEARFWESEAQMAEDESLWDTYFAGAGNQYKIGDTIQIALKGTDSHGNVTEVTAPTYTSSNPNVATVDSSGKVTCTGAGTASINIEAFNGYKVIKALMSVSVGK